MKKTILIAAAVLAVSAGASAADRHVNAYVRGNGTFVQGHMQTSPNATRLDNYSTRDNVNPYTGRSGTVDPYAPPRVTTPNPYEIKPIKPTF